MAIEIPAEVNLVALGHTANYFRRKNEDRFTCAINNAHVAYRFEPDLIVAMDDFGRDKVSHPRYVDSIVNAGAPVISTRHWQDWPAVEPYPLDAVLDWLNLPPHVACKILSNSVNYAAAYLAMMGAEHIHFYGVEFVQPDRPGIVERQINFLDKAVWPDWTIYYMEALLRSPEEPGLDGFCWLVGFMHARNIKMKFPTGIAGQFTGTTFMDFDRPNFFYGYQDQPYVL